MDAVDEVKNRLNIEDVIGEYVALKRTGRNFKGLSPFSSERTPSFVVSPEKQIWKDFSSGRGGSMFDFVMIVEGLEFKDALELLARKAGIDLEAYRPKTGHKGPDRKRLYELLELSAKFYQVQFSKSNLALEYVFKKRKFTKETALAWRLGYAPNTGSALINFIKKNNFSDEEIKQAGLSSTSYSASGRDMFRERLIVPLQDSEGRVIGFTARLLIDNDKAPKYINTPQTPLYDKSRHVYGLHLAKESIRKSNYAVMVEGNLDVIASHQAGVAQTVATAGTALTEYHLKTINRFTGDVRLCFDSDKAGIAASERAIILASKVNVSLSIIDVPEGKDPDELIRMDVKKWQQAVNHNKYALDWLVDHYKDLLDVSSAQGKRQFSDVLLPVVNQLSDAVEKDHYLNLIAKTIDIDKDALNEKMEKSPSKTEEPKKPISASVVVNDKATMDYIKAQHKFLSLVLMRSTLRELLDRHISSQMMPSEEGKELFELLKANPEFNARDTTVVQNLEDYVKIESLLYEELYQGTELNELHEEASRLKADLVTKFVKTEKEKIASKQRGTASESDMRLLLEQDKKLNDLLNEVKGVANG